MRTYILKVDFNTSSTVLPEQVKVIISDVQSRKIERLRRIAEDENVGIKMPYKGGVFIDEDGDIIQCDKDVEELIIHKDFVVYSTILTEDSAQINSELFQLY